MPRKRKDPDMPKRPLSSYMFYSRDRRPKLQEEKPSLQFGDYSKLIAEEWKTLDAEAKQPYLDMSKKDKERYEEALKEYKEKKKNEPPPPMQADFSAHKNFTTQDHIDHHQQQQQRNFMLQRQQQQEMLMRQHQMRQAPPHVLQQMQQGQRGPWGQMGQYMFPQQGQGYDQGSAPNPRLAQMQQANYAAYYNQYPSGYPGMQAAQAHHFQQQQQQHSQGQGQQGQQYDGNQVGENSDDNQLPNLGYQRQQIPRGMPDPRGQLQAPQQPGARPASGSQQMYHPGFPGNPYQFYNNPSIQQQMQQQFQDRIPPHMMYQQQQQQMRAQMNKDMSKNEKPKQGASQPQPFSQPRGGLDMLQAQRGLELGAQRGSLEADGSGDFPSMDHFSGPVGVNDNEGHAWDNWPDVEEGMYGTVLIYEGPRKGHYGYYKETLQDDSGNAIVELKSTGEQIAVDINDLKRVPEGVQRGS